MKAFWVFNPGCHSGQVRGHQLERLRLRILMRADRVVRIAVYWDGRHLHIGTASTHRTRGGRLINLIARIKRRLHPPLTAWCCPEGEARGVEVCPECAEFCAAYQAELGVEICQSAITKKEPA